MIRLIVAAVTSVIAGAVASVAGFGIGSILTPVLEPEYGIRLAVAAVSLPHLAATALRLWRLRRHIDVPVLKSFGLMSAAGGLTGAVLQRYAASPALVYVFAGLLTFAGLAALTGLSERMRFGRRSGWAAGLASGGFGGLVGNQGGIRSAALLGYHLQPAAFVATATAVGLLVDAARVPVYAVTEYARLGAMLGVIGVTVAGAMAGTLGGARLLGAIPAAVFRRVLGALILALGLYMLLRAAA